MSTEETLRALDRMADAGILSLTISGGEPTLHPDLIPILAHARRRAFAVTLFTNGIRVDDTLADALASLHLLEIHISLYSDVPEEHDRITGAEGSFRRATSAIEKLAARGANYIVGWPVMAACSATLGGMRELATRLGAKLKGGPFISPREDGNTSPVELACSHAQIVGLYAHDACALEELQSLGEQAGKAADPYVRGV